MFHYDYAKAVLEVCRLTPGTLHWMPTRLGCLIKKLVLEGEILPENLERFVVMTSEMNARPRRTNVHSEHSDTKGDR